MFFNAEQVAACFKRLSSRDHEGKSHLERTSGLFYFLAFDAICKKKGRTLLDMNPKSPEGNFNRRAMELEFAKLVLIEDIPDGIRQVFKLGIVGCNGKRPGHRISSNFLTVPLKKASSQQDPYHYPKRPAPLLILGKAATGMQWGVGYHEEWQSNLPTFTEQIISSTAFTDLAVFVFRDMELVGSPKKYTDALSGAIASRYTAKLSNFWMGRILKEKTWANHIQNPFTKNHSPFSRSLQNPARVRFEGMERTQLIHYIGYLEDLLTLNDVKYQNHD